MSGAAGKREAAGHGDCLGGLKVLELCNLVAGPYCAKLLGDLGAEVIKIEPPDGGDDARRRGPFLGDDPHCEKSGLYLYLNTNKLGVTLDVRTEMGKRLFKELVGQSDVLVEDNPPAVMEGLGLGYSDLKEINERLVMVSLTPFGQTGPYRDYGAYELNCFHAGGEGYMLPYESEYPDREPVKGGGVEADCACGLSAAFAALAAVYGVRATGLGQHVDVSKQEVLMTLVGLELSLVTYSDIVRTRHSRQAIMATPVKCRDGHVMISPWPDPVWEKFARLVGNEAWVHDDSYLKMVNRKLHGDEIGREVLRWAGQHDREDLFHQLQENGVAAAPVNTAEDIVASGQMQSRGFFSEIEHPEAGNLSYPVAPYKLSETPCRLQRPAPLLGEHNQLVFCERLGYDKRDLAAMLEGGII